MKKFKFTLQSVYELSLSTEKQQQIQIKKLEDTLARLRYELEELKVAYLDGKDRLAEEMKAGLTSDKLTQYNVYFENLINTMISKKESILRVEEEREKWIQKIIETRKEIKTMEKLRDAQYEAYLFEERQESEKEIGDIVSFNVASK